MKQRSIKRPFRFKELDGIAHMARLYVENVNNAIMLKDYIRAKLSMMSASIELIQLTEKILQIEQSEAVCYTKAWDGLMNGEDFKYFIYRKEPVGHETFYNKLSSGQVNTFMDLFHLSNIFPSIIKNDLRTSYTMQNYCPTDYMQCWQGIEEQLGQPSDFWIPLYYNIYGRCRSFMTKHKKGFKNQKKPAKVKGRPRSSDLKGIISKKFDAEECIERLYELLQGQKGKRVAMIIKAAMDLKWFVEKPTFTQLAESCGVCGSKSGYDRQMNIQNFSKTELEAIMKELE